MRASNLDVKRNAPAPLPPGQRLIAEFPRFGIIAFARRPLKNKLIRLEISGAVSPPVMLTATELSTLPRTGLTADFHCAAGWTYRSLQWSGFRFKDVFDRWIAPSLSPQVQIGFVLLRCQDGYRTALPLADLLADDVLLADQLNGQPLNIPHGAPLRLVAPAHYGYKSVKHLDRIEFLAAGEEYRLVLPRLLDHPRARVAQEERGQILPGWLSRYLFRPFIRLIVRRMEKITAQSMDDAR